VLALLLFSAALAGLVGLANGPWLRVSAVTHTGERYTPSALLDEIVDGYRGASLLTVDSQALRTRLTSLPTVADASVELLLPGELRVRISEKAPAFVWRTTAVQLVGASDGTVLAELPLSTTLGAELAQVPAIDDDRRTSRELTIGDVLPAAELRVARQLVALDPEVIGSRARTLSVTMDDELGFVIVSPQPAWRAAMGFYEMDPREDQETADARLEQQLAAIRTLFATRDEGAISWLDARNPGRVYWAP
jgi:cell division septal protein FtsQ